MDYMKQPVLEVGNIDEDINLSLPPTSGEEYIKHVVMEARQCADVVVADINPSCISRGSVKTLAGCVRAPMSLVPTLEWQQYQVSDFSNVRLYTSRLKDEMLLGKRKKSDIHLPDISDEHAWIDYCLRSEEKPTLDILFSFNQSIVMQVLEYLVHLVETERRIDYNIGQWIYALLVILEQPLEPVTCSCLRSLARACSIIRVDSRDLDAQELGALNLFISLVARYFRQLDLADPSSEISNTV